MTTESETTPRSFLFLLGSARKDGNTELLARQAASRLPGDVEQRWLHLADLRLNPFPDLRHVGDGVAYPQPTGNERTLLDATLGATDLVIASPLYWYSVSADTKLYLDHWSAWMRVPGIDFKARMRGRTLWGVAALAGQDHQTADPLAGTLRRCADYLGMRWGGVLMGTGSEPGQVLGDASALERADTFFDASRTPVTSAAAR
ncbi:flavodoxin family protein [Wenjunlia tyrosinilytica]|uniref:flavodoxin family protein n=1 Tax=Wenjunlia tyrosinilytica TaxID=1544741 RepID=UPI00166A58B4|nr:NAD(P)H-dependent oxidoreductase [Wenjunlia tyrosinilytica]